MPRQRTAKNLGQRHDLHYFQRWTRWRIVRAALMIAVPLVAAAWLLTYAARRNSTPYISGPLASVHSFTGQHCESCHAPLLKAGAIRVGFRKHVSDDACLSCHRAPTHQKLQTFTPRCGSCHVEHVGSQHLRQVADESCVQCHGDLKVRSGTPHFETTINNFNSRHPEFAPLRSSFRDPGTIKLNHAIHMRPGLLGPNSQPVQLECQDCHRSAADQSRPWKYGEARLLDASAHLGTAHDPQAPPDPPRPDMGRAYMAVPTYKSACQSCHTLQFDSHFSESVPHDTPQVVHEFVVAKLTDYIRRHPEAVSETPEPTRIILGGSLPRKLQQGRIVRSSEEWVRLRTEDAETLLWRKTCAQCHTLQFNEHSALPRVASANMKAIWLPNSMFSHYAHQAFECQSCHTRAASSQETSDVLIPGIQTCRQCHNGNPIKFGQTQNGCFLCHQYHDWSRQDTASVAAEMLPNIAISRVTDARLARAFALSPLIIHKR